MENLCGLCLLHVADLMVIMQTSWQIVVDLSVDGSLKWDYRLMEIGLSLHMVA